MLALSCGRRCQLSLEEDLLAIAAGAQPPE